MYQVFKAVVVATMYIWGTGLAISSAYAEAPVRISVLDYSNDPAKVAVLKKGIESMRQASSADPMSATYRTSFAYWSNTHGYFGTGTHATDMKRWVAQRMPGCVAQLGQTVCDRYYAHMVNTAVPADGFTDDVWGTCQHGNLNFLPWHRMFLHFYEKTLRKHSGDDDFALPYWDYFQERSANGRGLALPKLVRGRSTGTLYDEWRTMGLNENTSAIDPTSASAVQAFKHRDFIPFSDELQGQPHGVMHCAVGTGCSTPDMGFVPIAGLDPVFYMHHSNIDRLWQCWLNRKAAGATIDLAWAKANLGMPDSWYDTSYTFADENGNEVNMTIAEVFVPGVIDARYDNDTSCVVEFPKAENSNSILTDIGSEPKAMKAHPPLKNSKAVSLTGDSVTVSLVPHSDESRRTLSALPEHFSQKGHTVLLLDDVRVNGVPSLTYQVYLSSQSNPKKAVYIATFNLFGAGGHGSHGDHGASLGTLSYNVTDDIYDLGVESAEELTVRFVPTTLMLDQAPKTEATDSGITVGHIRLETIADEVAGK